MGGLLRRAVTFAEPLWSVGRRGTGGVSLANSDWEFSVSGLTVEAAAGV